MKISSGEWGDPLTTDAVSAVAKSDGFLFLMGNEEPSQSRRKHLNNSKVVNSNASVSLSSGKLNMMNQVRRKT